MIVGDDLEHEVDGGGAPRVVRRFPSITKTDLVRFTSSNSSMKESWFSQWIVALRPSRSPALASAWAAVQSPPMVTPRRASRRSQFRMGRVVAAWTSMPPQISAVSSRDSSIRSESSLKPSFEQATLPALAGQDQE
jgi:hypothetical protein